MNQVEPCNVFYSWQSDLPNSTNRSFIETALNKVAKAVRADESISLDPVIDRDTAGELGAPNIADTIYQKIEKAQVFVCDVSIISKGAVPRPTPNPNVLVELGYASKVLGWPNILMVMNTAFGPVTDLPFDLRGRRVLQYNLPDPGSEKAQERRKLESQLKTQLGAIVDKLEESPTQVPAAGSGPTFVEKSGYSDPNDPSFGVNDWTDSLGEYQSDIKPTPVRRAISWLSVIFELASEHSVGIDKDLLERMRTPAVLTELPRGRFIPPVDRRTTQYSAALFDWHDRDKERNWRSRVLRMDAGANIEYADSAIVTQSSGQRVGIAKPIRVFAYVQMIGRIWQFLFYAHDLLESVGYNGDGRLVVSLVGTRGTILGDFSRVVSADTGGKWLNPFATDGVRFGFSEETTRAMV